ncbi:MAG: HAD hydrolase-like protein [Candidatus Eisenbacteria bacterium]|nr:HAD hydrolase-like protein [Candidatus Eisenbacteria bacterium]
MSRRPRLILFDIDGTLLRARGAGAAAFRRALASALGRELPEFHVDYAGRTDLYILTESLRALGQTLPPTADLVEQILSLYVSLLPEELERVEEAALCPGVPEVLEELQSRPDVHLGVLTGNTRAGALTKLRFFEIASYFEVGAYGEATLYRHELVALAMSAARQHWGLEWRRDDVWLVGDTPHDIDAARRAGVKVAAVATGPFPREQLAPLKPDLLLADLTDPGLVTILAGEKGTGRRDDGPADQG